MTHYGIARFVGSWVSASGYRLRIKKVRKDQASVDFLDPRGAPVQRPYMGGAASVKMIAHYDDYNGILGERYLNPILPMRLGHGKLLE